MLRRSSSIKVELKFEELSCAICLENFDKKEEDDELASAKNADLVVALTCNERHTFHPQCLEEWLTRSPECPLCKTDVFSS